MKKETARKIRCVGWAAFLIYILVLVYLLFLSEELGRGPGTGQARYNLLPFREIHRFLANRDVLGQKAVFANIAGNVLLFVPFGAILPVLRKRMRSLGKMAALSAALSLAIELLQLATRSGAFDVDDILLNTLGGILGYGIFTVCNRIRRKTYG